MKAIKHYSQMSQDLFVNHLLDCDEGFFVDVGCYEPKFINNTYMLEERGWRGLLIDTQPRWIDLAKSLRSPENKLALVNLMGVNFNTVLQQNNCPPVIDYIDLDIDEATLKVVTDIDHDLFSFKIITVEHDYYKVDEPGSDAELYRSECRRIFSEAGYKLVCADVGNNSGPQEDWYVNPKYIPEDKWKPLVCSNVKHLEVRKLMKIDDQRLNWPNTNYNAWHDEAAFT